MRDNETTIRELYSLAEGDRMDMEAFVSAFSADGYMTDIPAGATFRGQAIGDYLEALAAAFPDIHRELLRLYVAGNVVVVELAIRGTHTGALSVASEVFAPTRRTVDVPCCDVFELESGKVTSFHCYNAASVMQQQLGITAS